MGFGQSRGRAGSTTLRSDFANDGRCLPEVAIVIIMSHMFTATSMTTSYLGSPTFY
jgi:hypothetical protein